MAGFTKNLTINSFQLFINQGLTLLVFFLLARNLSKPDFGSLNMILALLLTSFGILSFGIDQLLQKKIAEGEPPAIWLPVSLIHYLLTGSIFYLVLVFLSLFSVPVSSSALLILALGKLAFSLSTPYKQVMTGLERFNLVFRMSIVSSLVKTSGLIILYASGQLSLLNIAIVFLAGDALELFYSVHIFKKQFSFSMNQTGLLKKYRCLVKEALPQLGTVMFAAAMARFDWIFIGFFLSTSALAEYSFAYRVYEIALFPMLVIAPLLVPGFTRKLRQQTESTEQYGFLLRMEMLAASLILLLLNLFWEPLAGYISDGKYGEVNSLTLFILSLSMPLMYYNNFLWSMHFARGRTKFIFLVFAFTFLLNITGNLILIPSWGNPGAALSYLIAILFQTILYHANEPKAGLANWRPVFFTSLAAMAGITVSKASPDPVLSISSGILLYLFLLILSRQLLFSDGRELKQFTI